MSTPANDLGGLSVLVVEDNYYQAEDARVALERAGAVVLGPCSNSAQALALIEGQQPDGAVLDVNLGRGPDFDLARTLLERGLKVLLVTGYDTSVIPAELRHLPRLQKPSDRGKIVAAVANAFRPG